MNDLSFDTAKLGIKNTPSFLFVSYCDIRKNFRKQSVFSLVVRKNLHFYDLPKRATKHRPGVVSHRVVNPLSIVIFYIVRKVAQCRFPDSLVFRGFIYSSPMSSKCSVNLFYIIFID